MPLEPRKEELGLAGFMPEAIWRRSHLRWIMEVNSLLTDRGEEGSGMHKDQRWGQELSAVCFLGAFSLAKYLWR